MCAQVLTKTPTPELPKEPTRPLPSSASSTSSRTSGGSESGSPASLSTKQLVYIAADIQKLQEQVHTHKLNTYITRVLHIFQNCYSDNSSDPFFLNLLNCFHTDSLLDFLSDTRVVRDDQKTVRSDWIQKLCCGGR